MGKRICSLSIALIIWQAAAFAQAYDTKIDYQKTQQSVAAIDLPYRPDIVEDAVKDYMVKRGYKSSSSKGFDVYRSYRLDSVTGSASDLYIRIDKKKGNKDFSVVSLLPTRPNEDILSRSVTDSTGQIDHAKAFLNILAPYVDAHNLQVQVDDQQDVLHKAQKKMTSLVNDQADIEKKIRNIQADQEQNKIDILKMNNEIQLAVNSDADVKNKQQKKMNKYLDEQDNLRKKMRKAEQDLDENKTNQQIQQKEVDKQQQALDAIKAKQQA